jgi:hypothetical protein
MFAVPKCGRKAAEEFLEKRNLGLPAFLFLM